MGELISDTPQGAIVTRLEDMTDEQLARLAVAGSQDALDELSARVREGRRGA